MQPDPRKFLWDVLRAVDLLRQFADGKTFEDCQGDVLLRSAVERQFETVGESLSQLGKTDPALASQVPELPRIVAFRNITTRSTYRDPQTAKIDTRIAETERFIELARARRSALIAPAVTGQIDVRKSA